MAEPKGPKNWRRKPNFRQQLDEEGKPAVARKGGSPKGMRKAGRQEQQFKPGGKALPPLMQDINKKFTSMGGHAFEKVGDNAYASPDGMTKEQLEDFVQSIHGSAGQQPNKEPHLIDRILDGGLFNPYAAPTLTTLQHAKKFIFDASASEFLGTLLVKAQGEVLGQHNWARPPFDVTWVEFDHAAYWERGLKMKNDYSKGEPDNLFGFLVDHGTVSLFSYAPASHAANRTKKPCGVGPFMYQLHTPISFEEEIAMARKFGMNLNLYRQALLGGMIDKDGNPTLTVEWWNSMAGEVVRSHKMFVNPAIKGEMDSVSPETRRKALVVGAGDLKLVISMLLMVTRPRKMLTVAEVGPKRMLYKGHNLVRRAHSVITMRLSKEAAIQHSIHHEFTSQHRQMHDVRGHWAETRTGLNICRPSEHEWEPIDKDHFYCLRCPAKRWWRKAHTRGELRLGDKTTDYTVTR